MAKAAIEVWWMPVGGLSKTDVKPWQSLLDADERERAARYAHIHSHIEYVAAHALARTALSSISGEPVDAWKFVSGAHGKPCPMLGNEASDHNFSISHTKGMVAVAVSQSVEVGLDLEGFRRTVDLRIAGKAFNQRENAWLQNSEPNERTENFLRLWTLKEAYVKATGRGLAQPLNTFWFEEIDPPSVRFTSAIDDNPDAWHFEQHILGEQFISALAFHDVGANEPSILWKRCTAGEIKSVASMR